MGVKASHLIKKCIAQRYDNGTVLHVKEIISNGESEGGVSLHTWTKFVTEKFNRFYVWIEIDYDQVADIYVDDLGRKDASTSYTNY